MSFPLQIIVNINKDKRLKKKDKITATGWIIAVVRSRKLSGADRIGPAVQPVRQSLSNATWALNAYATCWEQKKKRKKEGEKKKMRCKPAGWGDKGDDRCSEPIHLNKMLICLGVKSGKASSGAAPPQLFLISQIHPTITSYVHLQLCEILRGSIRSRGHTKHSCTLRVNKRSSMYNSWASFSIAAILNDGRGVFFFFTHGKHACRLDRNKSGEDSLPPQSRSESDRRSAAPRLQLVCGRPCKILRATILTSQHYSWCLWCRSWLWHVLTSLGARSQEESASWTSCYMTPWRGGWEASRR